MRIYAVFALFGALAGATRDPMANVLAELEKLRNRINSEMEEEARNYEDYACFCRDTQEEKGTKISNLQEDQTAQQGTITEQNSEQAALRFKINGKSDTVEEKGNLDKIAYLENEIQVDTDAENASVAAHNADAEELQNAINACEEAVDALNKGIGVTSLIQQPIVQQVLALGQAMGFQSAMSLLQTQPEVDQADSANSATNVDGVTQQLRSDQGSRDVIAMVEDLMTRFRDELKTQVNERLAANKVHNEKKQADTQALVNEKASLEQNQKALAAATEKLQNAQKDYTQSSRMIDQDTAYLNDLANECTKKKQEYDQRSSFSLEELQMLAMVETILSEKAKAHHSYNRGGLIQMKKDDGPQCEATHQAWRDEEDGKADGEQQGGWTAKLRPEQTLLQAANTRVAPQASLLETFAAAPAFLQRRMTVTPHNEVAAALRASADEIGSPTLAALATKVDSMAPGVFDRVNTLIRELIGRLQKEQSADIAHHGYCNQQMSEMEQSRDTAKTNMDDAAAAASAAHARAESLRAEINALQLENAETQRAWMEAHRIRECSKEQNTNMLSEVQKGQATMKKAMDTVKEFFERMQTDGGDAGDSQEGAGGDADTAKSADLKGAQTGRSENWRNIVALMSTISDELAKNEEDTTAQEAQETKDYNQFESDSKADMSAKHATRSQKQAERQETLSELGELNDKFSSELGLLNAALKMWEDLRQSCQSEGVKPEERAAKRQAEIKALRQALEVLNQVTAH